MIAITAYKNSLQTRKKECCFRSVADQTLSSEQLIKEIIGYNSTITEADARAVLSVLNDRVKHFVNLGYDVELPFAYIHLRANGTSDRLNDGFMPGVGDHRFEATCVFKADAAKEMEATNAWRIAGVGWSILPKITELVSRDAAGKENGNLTFKSHDILRIKGQNLSFDALKEEQGVFFVDDSGTKTRADRYFNVGTSITDVFIPDGLAPGNYKVQIVTSPRKDSLEEFTSSEPVVVLDSAGQP